MKCPILTADEYKAGFENGLTFHKQIPFHNNKINWAIGKLIGTYNEEGDLELIGTDKERKEIKD